MNISSIVVQTVPKFLDQVVEDLKNCKVFLELTRSSQKTRLKTSLRWVKGSKSSVISMPAALSLSAKRVCQSGWFDGQFEEVTCLNPLRPKLRQSLQLLWLFWFWFGDNKA